MANSDVTQVNKRSLQNSDNMSHTPVHRAFEGGMRAVVTTISMKLANNGLLQRNCLSTG